jgi:hypothetical protein
MTLKTMYNHEPGTCQYCDARRRKVDYERDNALAESLDGLVEMLEEDMYPLDIPMGKCTTKQDILPGYVKPDINMLKDMPSPGFITKDSGKRQEYDSGMVRDLQDGKPDFSLIFPDMPYQDQPITRWAALMTRGADKYGRRNWQVAKSAEEVERFKASALRHMMQWMTGENDEDHMAAVMFNLNAAEYVKWKLKQISPDNKADQEVS